MIFSVYDHNFKATLLRCIRKIFKTFPLGQEKHLNRNLKVHQKSTFSSRMKSRSHLSKIVFYSDTAGGSFENFGLDPTLVLRLTEGKSK